MDLSLPVFIKDVGKKEFYRQMFLRFDAAHKSKKFEVWSDLEINIGLNLHGKNKAATILSLLIDPDSTIDDMRYCTFDRAARKLAQHTLGGDVVILAKMQRNGEWTTKITCPMGEATCSCTMGLTLPQAIVWCILRILQNEAEKD